MTIINSKPIYENDVFVVLIGTLDGVNDPEPQYLVVNKHTNIVEFSNASLYFAKDWAWQFQKALARQEEEWKRAEEERAMMGAASGWENLGSPSDKKAN